MHPSAMVRAAAGASIPPSSAGTLEPRGRPLGGPVGLDMTSHLRTDPLGLASLGAALLACIGLPACAGGLLEEAGSAGTDGDTADESDTAQTDTDSGDDDTPGSDDDETDDGECSAAGCACSGSPDSCDDGLVCSDGTCVEPSCNNDGIVDPGELCDDGNSNEGDGCNTDCTPTQLHALAAGRGHTCALIERDSGEGFRVRCWGLNHAGQLGYSNTDNIGDNETPGSVGDLVFAEPVAELSIRADHGCALLIDGSLVCWGEGFDGQLGQGSSDDLGDDEFPFDIPALPLAGVLTGTAGGRHSCALIEPGNVRCWGHASSGQLGYGDILATAVPLDSSVGLGGTVVLLRSGNDHNCAILDSGDLRCWGRNERGQLGYGNTNNIGDTEAPSTQPTVPLFPMGIDDADVLADIALGDRHTCALYESGRAVCWGANGFGQLGQGNTANIGDNETLTAVSPLDFGDGATVEQIVLGRFHTCARLDSGDVKCWGRNVYGQLGRGDTEHFGDEGDEDLANVDPIDLGGRATDITAGDYHTCAIVDGREVRCWGFNDFGQLGYGDTLLRGDDESPAEAGAIELLCPPGECPDRD